MTPARRDWPLSTLIFVVIATIGGAAITWLAVQVPQWLGGHEPSASLALRAALTAIENPGGIWDRYSPLDRAAVAAPLALGVPLTLILATITAWWGGTAPTQESQLSGRVLCDDVRHATRVAAREAAQQRGGEGLHIHPDVAISRDRETRGIGVIGSIGGGKTTVLQPLVLAALARGDRAIVLDGGKGDYSAGLLGLPEVATLAPWDRRSLSWDVAHDIDTASAAEEFASRLIPVSRGDNPMWANGARAILAGAIIAQMRARPGVWSLADVGSLITAPYAVFRRSTVTAHPATAQFLPEKPTNTTTSFLANLGAFLAPVYKLADAWSPEGHGQAPNTISLRDWLTKPGQNQCLILGVHGAHEQTATGLAQAVLGYIRSIVASPDLPDDPDRRIWLFLDEFPQLGKIEGFEKFVEIGRSKGVRVCFGAQDIAQIRGIYGPDVEKTWTSSVGTWIVTRSQGVETPRWLAQMVGDGRWERATKSQTRGSFLGGQVAPTETIAPQIDERPVLRPEEFATGLGPTKQGVRAILFAPDWTSVYRLTWPFSALPGSAPPVDYAPWTRPGWPDSAAVAQAALAEVAQQVAPDGSDRAAPDDDDGEPRRPPAPPVVHANFTVTSVPTAPAIDPDLLPIFDDPTPAHAASERAHEGAHEGALEALGAKAAEHAAENLIGDVLGDETAHAVEIIGHALDALDSASSPGTTPRIVTRADAIRARREARRAQEHDQEPQDHDGQEPGQ